MAASIWFTPELNENLTKHDCDVLNRATRILFPAGNPHPTYKDLSWLRRNYEVGDCPADLLDRLFNI